MCNQKMFVPSSIYAPTPEGKQPVNAPIFSVLLVFVSVMMCYEFGFNMIAVTYQEQSIKWNNTYSVCQMAIFDNNKLKLVLQGKKKSIKLLNI